MKTVYLIILACLFFFLLRFVFIVREVNCLLPSGSLEAGVCEKIKDHFRGSSLFFTDFENATIWDDLLTSKDYSHSYHYQEISKSLSGLVDLTLSSKLPDYRLITSEGRFLLNQNSKLRSDQEELSLPSIEATISTSDLDRGYLDDVTHGRFLELAQALLAYDFSDKQVKWQSDQEIQLFLGDLLILLDINKPFEYQIERLQVIMNDEDLQEDLSQASTLDLRFNLPVLKKN